MILAKRKTPDPNQSIEYYRRHPEITDYTDDELRYAGYLDNTERQMIKELFDQYPNIQEQLQFLTRNVHDVKYLEDYRLLEGFGSDADIQEVMGDLAPQGSDVSAKSNWWASASKELRSIGITKKLAGQHFASHWINPSLQELRTLVQRLRPDRVGQDLQFTQEDFTRLLVEQDIAPYFRERLLRVAYNPVGIRWINRLFNAGTIDKKEAIEVLQDNGFRLEDATKFAEALEIERRRKEARDGHAWTPPQIQKFYQTSTMDKPEAIARLTYLGFSEEEANDTLDTADEMNQQEILVKTIASLEKSYLAGRTNEADATNDLIALGLTNERVNNLMTHWKLERSLDVHDLNAKEIIDKFKRGIIDINTAVNYLINLNYSNEAIGMMLASAVQDIDKANMKAQQSQIKEQEKLAKQIEAQLTKVKKRKKLQDKVAIDLDKARRKVKELDTRAKLKATLRKSTLTAKQQAGSGILTIKEQFAQFKQTALDDANLRIVRVRAQLMLDLAVAETKTEKAQLRAVAAS